MHRSHDRQRVNTRHSIRTRPAPWMFLLATGIFFCDWITKEWVLASFELGESVPVLPGFLYWTYVRNDGIAFGLLQGNNALTGFLVVLILGVAGYWARHLCWERVGVNIFGGLVLGGALGNLVDRVRHGYVVDFVDVDLGFMRWPAFNVADCSICIAMGLMLILTFCGVPIIREPERTETG